jgi:hypothetical protein
VNAPADIEVETSVYAKIAAVQGELAQTGIGKDSKNSFDKYMFRGIDAVYNALAPLLARHRLCVLPRMIDRDLQERVSRKGDPMFYVTVTAEFDFVSADDGSTHTVQTYGEAMDRGDKATNKAMSAAYKYAAFMTFAIPTEGDNDADASSHEVAPQEGHSQGPAQDAASPPANYKFPEGPTSGITQLKTEVRNLWREIVSCGDDEQLHCLLETTEAKELIEQASKLENPTHREQVWTGDGKDNPGLRGLIEQRKAELNPTPNILQAG